ncbi:MAG: hypothetical protein WHS83_06010 [Chloroflexus sp.]|uniref:hypothetical protein n=1 Tax=Chloroflexus sp. TaxID=1904827 RepID=UPI003095BE85
MACVEVTCSNFSNKYARINGKKRRKVSRFMVLRSVVTVGFQRFTDIFLPWWPTLQDSWKWSSLLHRFGMGLSAFSFLRQSSADLCLDHSFQALDSSEKAVVSYWCGMALAKIVADTELEVPWLMHVDVLHKKGALILQGSTNERGDLVGLGKRDDWHVVEAKGRSNKYHRSLVEKARKQAERIVRINDKKPATNSACITSLFTQPISVLLEDPPADGEENGEQWNIRQDDFFRNYYGAIITYLRQFGASERRFNTIFVTAPLAFFSPYLANLEIGLLETIFNNPERAREFVRDLPRDLDEEGRVGSDGIAIFGELPE